MNKIDRMIQDIIIDYMDTPEIAGRIIEQIDDYKDIKRLEDANEELADRVRSQLLEIGELKRKITDYEKLIKRMKELMKG